MVGQGAPPLACPYFIPSQPHPSELWPHRHRLPLGDGYAGRCGVRPAKDVCQDESLRLHCNLGYAGIAPVAPALLEADQAPCPHLPAGRDFDAVRFQLCGVEAESGGRTTVRVRFACERGHRPALCGELRYDRAAAEWTEAPDERLRALADAAVRAWIARHDAQNGRG
jgi:hypothetical protein